MALRAGRPFSAELEVLDMYSRLDLATAGTPGAIHDPTRRAEVRDRIELALERSLGNPSRLHGWRVQGLFEAVVVCLGKVSLIKQEDAGTYHFDDSDGDIKLPDFRVMASDGELLLIEVKAVSPKNSLTKQKIRRADFDALHRYAKLAGGRLMVAHYWSAWNTWTVVDAQVMQDAGTCCELDFETAMASNEIVVLGDSIIGTTPPLEIKLLIEPVEHHEARSHETDENEFYVTDVEISAGGTLLTDPIEQRAARFLMIYGGWNLMRTPIPPMAPCIAQLSGSFHQLGRMKRLKQSTGRDSRWWDL